MTKNTEKEAAVRSKLSYANVISTLCLFLLLGGGAYAAGHLGKNTVGTKQLKKNAVTSAKVKNQTLTGSDINLTKLGTVPSAQHAVAADSAGDARTLQGNGPNGFIHGDGTTIVGRLDLEEGEEANLMVLPGLGRVVADCHVLTVLEMSVQNTSGAPVDYFEVSSSGPRALVLADGESGAWVTSSSETAFVQASTRGARPTVATIHITYTTVDKTKGCSVFGEATVVS